MRRRSARPFTVEIKQTRAPSAGIPTPLRKGHDLWGDLELRMEPAPPGASHRVAEGPADGLEAPSGASAEPVAVRRILPSLLPMFPEADARAVEDEPPTRLPRRKPTPRRRDEPGPEAPVAAAAPEPVAPPVLESPPSPIRPSQTVPVRSGRRAATRAATLGPGERWKRRLPRALW